MKKDKHICNEKLWNVCKTKLSALHNYWIPINAHTPFLIHNQEEGDNFVFLHRNVLYIGMRESSPNSEKESVIWIKEQIDLFSGQYATIIIFTDNEKSTDIIHRSYESSMFYSIHRKNDEHCVVQQE